MFDIGWGKIVIIAVIALVVIGPKELPAVLRTVGQWMGKIRRMAAEFQGQFQEAMREAEMADLKKSVDAITEATRDLGKGFDPIGSVRKDIETALDDKPAASAPPPAPEPPPATTEAPAAIESPVAVEAPAPVEAPATVDPPAAVEAPAAAPPVAPVPSDPPSQPAAEVAAPDHAGAAAPPPAENAGGRAA
jgi:sec-independent protein translocase protein TatB